MTIPAFQATESAGYTSDRPRSEGIPWGLYREGMLFLALRALGDRALAEDAVQETMVRALKALNGSDGDHIRDVPAFVYGIARHVIADAQRERCNHVHLSISDGISAEHPDALTALIGEESRLAIRALLRELPQSDQELLDLAFVDALKSSEIAVRLGESHEVIRKRKSRLIERLRARLSHE